MKKVLVINGVNLNMLGLREKELYGDKDFKSLKRYIKEEAKARGINAVLFQSNHEGVIVECIQKARAKYAGIIINAGAYTHTSVAILDALKAAEVRTIEVHLTNINAREEFRKQSYISLYAEKTICGLGFKGYSDALDCFL